MNRTITILLAAILAASVMTGLGCIPDSQANYTIALQRFPAAGNHIEQANRFQQVAEQLTGWDIDVVHETDGSVVLWGRYGSLEKAGRELKRVKTTLAPNGQPLFPWAMVIPMPGPAPGPAEWDLRNVKDPDAYYTVLVAVEFDVPEDNYYGYKKRVVDYTRSLREQNYEAYYHVVGDKALVCVGTFPRNAIETAQQTFRHPQTGDLYQQEAKFVRDERMKKLLEKDFPELLVVGCTEAHKNIDPQTGEEKMVKEPSQPYVIPGRDDSWGMP